MMFKPLPPGAARKLIEGYRDTLTPLATTLRDRVTSSPCPRCSGALHQVLHPSFMFTNASPLPRTVGRCVDCEYTVDPLTGIVLNVGNPAKVKEHLHEVDSADPA